MDSERFDRLVRSFGQTRSRRQTVRGLAGLAAVGALALGGQEADAGKRVGGSSCRRGRQCKTGKCVGEPGQKVCTCSPKYAQCAASDTSCQDGTCALCNLRATPTGGNCQASGVPCCSGTCSAGGDMPGCPRGADLCCD
jgi:hypothetical protein